LNPAKTEILWSATGRRLHQLPQLSLRVCRDLVLSTAAVRDLGVFIDAADLSMKTHVARTVSACLWYCASSVAFADLCLDPFSRSW